MWVESKPLVQRDESCNKLRVLCVITGYRGDAFLYQEAAVSGEPRIQFQGEGSPEWDGNETRIEWEQDKGGMGMRLYLCLVCMCV